MKSTTTNTSYAKMAKIEMKTKRMTIKCKHLFHALKLCISKCFIVCKTSIIMICATYWLLAIVYSSIGWTVKNLIQNNQFNLSNTISNTIFLAVMFSKPLFPILVCLFYLLSLTKLNKYVSLFILALYQLFCCYVCSDFMNNKIYDDIDAEIYKDIDQMPSIINDCIVIYVMNILAFLTIHKRVILSLTKTKINYYGNRSI